MATMEIDTPAPATLKRTRGQSLMDAFAEYRAELDTHYDRRERIIKQSRDITAQSKKLIFSAHRITNTDRSIVVKEVELKLKELKKMFEKLQDDVAGENFWRYEKSVSPGIQEYVTPSADAPTDAEAATTAPIADSNPAPTPQPFVLITIADYLGGIADLTGEMMRLAIGSVGKSLVVPNAEGQAVKGGEELPSIESIGKMVRDIKGEMDPLAPYCRWLGKKMTVLDQSLAKIESASYNLRIRASEYAGSPAMLASLADRGFGEREVIAA
ncbi:Translin [Leucosporidium creatinivorum]|uniref:Translin n=1 Tax=Leucosporidium creatinivorum TaxID=106004 RepID=A0A1Y2DGD0_9BASI|nr:Translin [Leucosporidium creatinivorum]